LNTDPTEGQLIAYNARDVDAFVPWFTEDVVVEDAMGARIVSGRAELRERYAPMFVNYPALNAAIVSRIRVGEFVLHEESVTGRQPEPEHVVAIYRVRGGLIDHVRFIR
jgi:putative hydrolase of HD superfamily